MADTSTNPDLASALGISEPPDSPEVHELTEEAALQELSDLLDYLESTLAGLELGTAPHDRAKFLADQVAGYMQNVKPAAEGGYLNIVSEQIEQYWDAVNEIETGEGFADLGYHPPSAAASSSAAAAAAEPSGSGSDLFAYDIEVDHAKVKKLGIKGVALPIRRQTVKRLEELAGLIEGLHENLNKASHRDAAQVQFHTYWGEVLEIADEAAQQDTDVQVREFYSMYRGGLLNAIRKAVADLSNPDMGLCNDEIAKWLREFCNNNKFDYF